MARLPFLSRQTRAFRGEGAQPWADSTLEAVRWSQSGQSGRRWARWGVLLGGLLGLLCFAPAAWLAQWVTQVSGGRLVLAQAQGTVWQGDAVVVLTAGEGSRQARALPGRLSWSVHSQGLGVQLRLQQACCLPEAVSVAVHPAWGRVQWAVQTDGAWGHWPAAALTGLGTPWNTLDLGGTLTLATQHLNGEWVQGRWRMGGQATVSLDNVSSRVSTLPRLGAYQLQLRGADQGQLDLALSTLDGALQLSGQGSLGPTGLHFQGEAAAQPSEQGALDNLLNIIGRRTGDRSVISIG